MLNAEAWSRLTDLFHQATELPESERITFAHAQTGENPELLHELLALIAADTDATRRLRDPMRHAAEMVLGALEPEIAPGTRFGPWAIKRMIGSGGMGSVYLAQRADGAYDREVALKLVRTRALDQRRRDYFEYERRLLARMQHPAIAQIHDAGIDPEGRAYLVMEYIHGQPISDWCDEHALTLRQRVELLLQAGEGVQHAHQKGVIHRDLKPRNVLVGSVDGRPLPKIIDFGIAWDIDDLDGHSVGGGTPGYMSPEQALLGADVDARSDVYSLGALLYELVCGTPPRVDALVAPSRYLQDVSKGRCSDLANKRSTRARALLRELREGLDAITLKALQPDHAARYDSVSALQQDLRRWLGHRLPAAAGSARGLALRKFIRRNRLAVAASVAVTDALLVGFAATVWSLAEVRAEAARNRVTSDFLASILDSVDPAISQDMDKTLMLRVLGDASKRATRELARYPDTLADIELIIAINQISLGEYDLAIGHLQSVRALAVEHPDKLAFQQLRALQVLGGAFSDSNRDKDAEAVLNEGIERARKSKPEHRWLVYEMQSRLSWALFMQGRAKEALRLAGESFDGFTATVAADDQQRLDAAGRYASMLSQVGEYDKAAGLLEDVIQRRSRINGIEHPLTLASRRDLAVLKLQKQDFAAAEPDLRRLLAAYRRLYGEESAYAAGTGGLLGSALREQGKVEEAGPYYRATMEWNAKRYGPDTFSSVMTRHNHANWLLAAGHAQQSKQEQDASLEIAERVLGRDNHVTGEILRGLAEAELVLGEVVAARGHAQQSLQVMRAVYGDEHEGVLRDALATLAKVEVAAGVQAASWKNTR